MRHLRVFLLLYVVLAVSMPVMEQSVLLQSFRKLGLYANLQNFATYRTNVVKASCLLTIWPYAVRFSPKFFVEMGCFSMSCFALACNAAPDMVREAVTKLYWYNLLREEGIRTPRLLAVSDRRGAVKVIETGVERGVRKPNRGMYANGVERATLEIFKNSPATDEILQEEIVDASGVEGRTYRVCTLRGRRGCNVISIFIMTLSIGCTTSIPYGLWKRLCALGGQLTTVHDKHMPWAPLVGWDVMQSADGLFVLEGNLGGSVGLHIIPLPTRLGWVRDDVAKYWIETLRDAHHAGVYKL